MNRQQRRVHAAATRRQGYDFPALADAMRLPVGAVEMMPSCLRKDIAAELHPPRNDAPALARTDPVRVAEFINSYAETWFKTPDAEPIACRAGCAHCCMIVPEISDGEATILRSAIARLPEVAQQQIAADMEVAADAVRGAGGAVAAWPLRCPLLGQDNRCQVYEARPSACRAWASEDAAKCATGGDVPVPIQTLVSRASTSFLRDIFKLDLQPLPVALNP